MSAILALLKLIPGTSWLYLGASLAILGAGGYVGHRVQLAVDEPKIAAAERDQARAERGLAQETEAFSMYQLQVERDRADDLAKAEAQRKGLSDKVAELEKAKATSDAQADKNHKQLMDALDAIKKTPMGTMPSSLDPALASYARSLRDIQAARTSGPAPAGDTDRQGVP